MKAVFKTLMICTMMSVWMSLPALATEKAFDGNGNGNVSVHEVRREMKKGEVDPENTCLDEYLKRSRNLAWLTGLTPPATAGLGAGATVGAIYGTAAAGVAAGYGLGAIILAIVAAYLVILASVVTLVGLTSLNVIKLFKNNTVLKFVAEAYEGKGKTLNRYFNGFLRKFRAHRGNVSLEQFAAAVVEGDKSGAYCDGSLRGTRSSSRLGKRLAKKKNILRYLNTQFQ